MKKQLTDEQFEALMDRAKKQCKTMKAMQDSVKIEEVLFDL